MDMGITPIYGCCTRPPLINWSATALALLMGIANPNPVAKGWLMMAVLMPMTSPWMLHSGPPLLPGLMAASVWIISVNWNAAPSLVGGTGMVRPTAETTPTVTVLAWANGLP